MMVLRAVAASSGVAILICPLVAFRSRTSRVVTLRVSVTHHLRMRTPARYNVCLNDVGIFVALITESSRLNLLSTVHSSDQPHYVGLYACMRCAISQDESDEKALDNSPRSSLELSSDDQSDTDLDIDEETDQNAEETRTELVWVSKPRFPVS